MTSKCQSVLYGSKSALKNCSYFIRGNENNKLIGPGEKEKGGEY